MVIILILSLVSISIFYFYDYKKMEKFFIIDVKKNSEKEMIENNITTNTENRN